MFGIGINIDIAKPTSRIFYIKISFKLHRISVPVYDGFRWCPSCDRIEPSLSRYTPLR